MLILHHDSELNVESKRNIEIKKKDDKFWQVGYGIRVEKNLHTTTMKAIVQTGLHSMTCVPVAQMKKPE